MSKIKLVGGSRSLVLGLAIALNCAGALAQPDARCIEALQTSDPTDSALSQASHFSHESVWAVRDLLWSALPSRERRKPLAVQPWREYLQKRYGRFLEHYADDPLQLMSLQYRIDAAAGGMFSELGELQIAEMYLLDPEVRTVEFIPELDVTKKRTPDLRVYFRRGGSKLVEVKSRNPGNLPNLEHVAERVARADTQIQIYKDSQQDLHAVRGDIEIVYHYPHALDFTNDEKADLIAITEGEFSKSVSLARMTIHLNNRPFLRLTHKFVHGEWTIQTVYLDAPAAP